MSDIFSRQELELLFEAVGVWEQQTPSSFDIGESMSTVFANTPKDAAEQIESKYKQFRKAAEMEIKKRSQRGVALRYKLIQMQDAMDASNFLDSSQSDSPKGSE